MIKRVFWVLLAIVLLMAGCQEKEDVPAQKAAGPKLVSCYPADGTQGLTGSELTVKMTFADGQDDIRPEHQMSF